MKTKKLIPENLEIPESVRVFQENLMKNPEHLLQEIAELARNVRSEDPRDYLDPSENNITIFSWEKAEEAKKYNRELDHRILDIRVRLAAILNPTKITS